MLKRIDPKLNPTSREIDQHIAENWRRRQDLPDDMFDNTREGEWRSAGCNPEKAPYVVEALTPRIDSAFGQDADSWRSRDVADQSDLMSLGVPR